MKSPNYYFIYCLAGEGSRFIKEGVNTPKFLLKLENNKTLLENSIINLNFDDDVKIFFIINYKHQKYTSQIIGILDKLNINYKIKIIKHTNGQAETAKLALNQINDNKPLFFFNGDTILKNRKLTNYLETFKNGFHGVLDVFENDSNNYSYIKIFGNLVIDIKEKVVISKYATTGLYGFKNSELYLKYYGRIVKTSETYISSIYKEMIRDSLKITFKKANHKIDTIILGTPKEFEKNKNLIK